MNNFNIYEHEDMFRDMLRCEDLCRAYNAIPSDEIEIRMDYLKHIFGKVNGQFVILSPFKCSLGYNIEIGDNVTFNSNVSILDGGKVKIGNNVLIGTNSVLSCSGHSVDPKRRKEGFGYINSITIEDNVYIGAGVIIVCSETRNITIGRDSVIGAGTVVTRDIPAGVLAVGNPARIVREMGTIDAREQEK
jgi:acetyltransferase-like isoleucine patch superfamily enzyme